MIVMSDEAGVLYGIVHILRLIAMEEALAGIDVACRPDNPLRMYDHWDNLDGSIERGYSGNPFIPLQNSETAFCTIGCSRSNPVSFMLPASCAFPASFTGYNRIPELGMYFFMQIHVFYCSCVSLLF